jgi:hypothetical protein
MMTSDDSRLDSLRWLAAAAHVGRGGASAPSVGTKNTSPPLSDSKHSHSAQPRRRPDRHRNRRRPPPRPSRRTHPRRTARRQRRSHRKPYRLTSPPQPDQQAHTTYRPRRGITQASRRSARTDLDAVSFAGRSPVAPASWRSTVYVCRFAH